MAITNFVRILGRLQITIYEWAVTALDSCVGWVAAILLCSVRAKLKFPASMWDTNMKTWPSTALDLSIW